MLAPFVLPDGRVVACRNIVDRTGWSVLQGQQVCARYIINVHAGRHLVACLAANLQRGRRPETSMTHFAQTDLSYRVRRKSLSMTN